MSRRLPSRRNEAERNKLASQWIPLALGIARKLFLKFSYVHRFGNVEDVEAEAMIALLRAAELWNDKGKANFQTYARKCITLYLRRKGRDSGLVRHPSYLTEDEFKACPTSLLGTNQLDVRWDELLSCDDKRQYDKRNLDIPFVEALLRSIPERSRYILTLRYGLEATIPKTLEEVARVLGLTRERVRQLQEEAEHRIKDFVQRNNINRNGYREE